MVVLAEGDHLPNQAVNLFMDRGELVRDAPQIDALDRGHELEGQDGIEVLHDGAALPRGGGAHAHVILLVGGGGDAVHAGGMGMDLVLGDDGGRRILADHVAGVQAPVGSQKGGQAVRKGGVHHALQAALGDGAELRRGDAQKIHDQGHRLPMEVAAGDDGLVLREEDGVVGDGVHLRLQDAAHVGDGIPHGPVDLGDAADGVGILDPEVLGSFRRGAVLQEQADVFGHQALALLGADGVDAGVEGGKEGGEGLHGHGGGDVGQLGPPIQVVPHQGADGGHALGAVDEGQALLGQQMVGLDAGPRHGLGPGELLPLIPGFPPAQDHQGHMGQRRQIARRAQGALAGHHGGHALVEHVQQALDELPADAGVALDQSVGPQEHHGPDHFLREGVAHGHAVAQDQVLLELGALLMAHVHLGEFAEAGGDAVDPAILLQDLFHQGTGPVDGLITAFAQPHRGILSGNGHHLLDGQALSVHNDRGKGMVHIHGKHTSTKQFFSRIHTIILGRAGQFARENI